MHDTDNSRALLGLTVQIVSAHLLRNPLPAAELPALIEQVHAALASAGAAPAPAPEKAAAPAAPKRTIFPDYIVCLEDGRKLKTLKRHLRSTYNLSPEEYREKWGLAEDYPMVAPNYAARRSSLAKTLGLGRKAAKPAEPEEAAPEPLAPMPRYIIAPAATPAPKAAPVTTAAEPPPRESRVNEPTLESVFGKFPRNGHSAAQDEPSLFPEAEAPEPAPEPPAKKHQRKPFSKQLARSMRP
jgi:predicted transcriptional regulator